MHNMIKILSLSLSLFLLAGCSIPNQARYVISPAGPAGDPRVTATAADQEIVKEILQTVAKRLKLQDMTASSLDPNTIVYYQEIDSNNPVKLIAWSDGGKILIELMHWPDQIGETLPYRSTREYIESELKRKFGSRSSVVAFKNLDPKSARPHQGSSN